MSTERAESQPTNIDFLAVSIQENPITVGGFMDRILSPVPGEKLAVISTNTSPIVKQSLKDYIPLVEGGTLNNGPVRSFSQSLGARLSQCAQLLGEPAYYQVAFECYAIAFDPEDYTPLNRDFNSSSAAGLVQMMASSLSIEQTGDYLTWREKRWPLYLQAADWVRAYEDYYGQLYTQVFQAREVVDKLSDKPQN